MEYDLYLIEKNKSLTGDECAEILAKIPKEKPLIPVCVSSYDGKRHAFGYITAKLYEKIDYSDHTLQVFANNHVFNHKKSTNGFHTTIWNEAKVGIEHRIKYHLCMKEKPIDTGLSPAEIKEMLDRMDPDEQLFPIEVENYNDDSSAALGFISASLYEALSYRKFEIEKFVTNKLFDTDSTVSDMFTDQINDFDIMLYR